MRNEKNIPRTVGPGDYSPEKATRTVKAENRAVDFARSPTRVNNFDGNTSGADCSFLTNYFGNGGTSYTMGTKKNVRNDQTPGPGSYK